jgi:hypothetical protein
MMTTSTELHTYQRGERKSKVFRSYEGFYVEFYVGGKLVERRALYEHSETYAENAAENFVDEVMTLNEGE